jgi:dTDP-4-amino-4,6-dideoxygalactose transaminase
MLIFEQRASTILYNILASNHYNQKFILPANICPIVPITFLKAQVPFEFVDISPSTLNIDEQLVFERLDKAPHEFNGLLFVHTYGDPSPFSVFFASLKEKFPSLVIIDDRCLCLPDFAEPKNNPADIVLYSTGYGKMIDVGSGGFAWIKPELSYKSNELRFEPSDLTKLENQYKTSIINRIPFIYKDSNWLNSNAVDHLDEFIHTVNTKLEGIIEHKNQLNSIYCKNLPFSIQLDLKFQLWRFSIRAPQKRKLLARIFKEGLFASSHYTSLDGIFGAGSFPQAEKLHDSVINLFNDYNYSTEQAEKTVQIINQHLELNNEDHDVQN